MIIAGIDYSMTSPAICIYDTSKPLTFDNFQIYSLNDKKKYQGVYGNIRIDPHKGWDVPERRYSQIAQWAMVHLQVNRVEEVVLEGYSMGSSAGLVFNIAENTSVLKQLMFQAGLKVYTPAPTSVKKTFHGKGNAKKPEMCDKFYERFGVKPYEIFGSKPADSPENDIVDSVANMLMHPHFTGSVE